MEKTGVSDATFRSVAPRLGFIGGFDGIRGVGIMAVLAQHAYPALFPSMAGFIDIFFVLSAFLIVSLLLQEHRAHDHIDMRKFYARRGIRLLPSAYLCLASWIVLSALFFRDRLTWVLEDAAAAALYVYNLIFPVGLVLVDPVAGSQRSIDQFWSLAVEEQFYLAVAVTVLICIRKRWMTQLAILMVVLASAIGIARWMGQSGPWPFTTPRTDGGVVPRGLSLLWLSRYDSLMWGVALAVFNAKLPDPLPRVWRRWLPRVAWVGAVVAMITMWLSSGYLFQTFGGVFDRTLGKLGIPFPYVPMFVPLEDAHLYSGKLWIQFGHTLTALAIVPVILTMARHKEWKLNVWLSWKPIRFLGRMSYTLYIWHTLWYFLILDAFGGERFLGEKWRVPILMVIAVVASLPVYFGVEQRLLRVKLKFSSEKEVVDLNTGRMIRVEDGVAVGEASSNDAAAGTGAVTDGDRGASG